MSISGNRASAGRTAIKVVVIWDQEFSIAGELEINDAVIASPFGLVLGAANRAFRYGAKLLERVDLIWSGVGLELAGHDAASMKEESLETTVSTAGTWVNRIGLSESF